MNEPRPPQIPSRRGSRETNFGTFLALFFMLMIAAGFLLLMGIATGGGLFFVVPLIILGGALFGMLHYLIWGRLLGSIAAEDEDPDVEEL